MQWQASLLVSRTLYGLFTRNRSFFFGMCSFVPVRTPKCVDKPGHTLFVVDVPRERGKYGQICAKEWTNPLLSYAPYIDPVRRLSIMRGKKDTGGQIVIEEYVAGRPSVGGNSGLEAYATTKLVPTLPSPRGFSMIACVVCRQLARHRSYVCAQRNIVPAAPFSRCELPPLLMLLVPLSRPGVGRS